MAILLDGGSLARSLNQGRVKPLAASLPRPPGLAVILVGADAASQVYVRRKGLVAGRVGFHHLQLDRPPTITQSELLDLVLQLNAD